MANLKISELPEVDANGITDADIIPIVAGGITNKVSKSNYLKTITDAIATINNTLTNGIFSFISFTPQGTPPAYQEGRVYYGNNTLNVYSDIAGVTLNVGEEQRFRVINRTGATITNGFAVKQDGHDAISGRLKVVLAQADTFKNALAVGIATHDIPNDTEGYITTFGSVGDADISLIAESGITLSEGSILYLSETEAGKVTDIAPDIATRLGGILTIDTGLATMLVDIDKLVNLPTVSVYFRGLNATSYNTTATPQDIVDYANVGEVAFLSDILLGTHTMSDDGFYESIVTSTLSFASNTSTRTAYIDLVKNGVIEYRYPVTIPRDAIEQGLSFVMEYGAVANDVIKVQISSSDNMNINIDDISFSTKSVHIR